MVKRKAKPATPKQKAARAKWQAAGAAARRGKGAAKMAITAGVVRTQTAAGQKRKEELVTLYHATYAKNARAIMREGFTWRRGQNRAWGQEDVFDEVPKNKPRGIPAKPIWFSTKPPSMDAGPEEWVWEKFTGCGLTPEKRAQRKPVVLKVQVPKRLLHRDQEFDDVGDSVSAVMVNVTALKGVKVTQWRGRRAPVKKIAKTAMPNKRPPKGWAMGLDVYTGEYVANQVEPFTWKKIYWRNGKWVKKNGQAVL